MQQRLAALALNIVCSEIMVEKNAKDMIWQQNSRKGNVINGMRIEWYGFILSTKHCVKKNEAKAYINNVDDAVLEYY